MGKFTVIKGGRDVENTCQSKNTENFPVIDGGLIHPTNAQQRADRALEKYRAESIRAARELCYGADIVRGIETAQTRHEIQLWLVTGRTRR